MLEANPSCVGGRTASWNKDGMEVESGLHRILGFYTAFPQLVKKAGLKMKDVVIWEDEIEVKVANNASYVYGASPVFRPFKTFSSPFRNNLLSWAETWKVFRFFMSGMATYSSKPEKLDEFSVLEYAQRFQLSEETIQRMIVPLTSGLFFLPPERYSAYVFFGPFMHALKRFYRVRIGAFRGGMTDVLAGPVAEKITGLVRDCSVNVISEVPTPNTARSTGHTERVNSSCRLTSGIVGSESSLEKDSSSEEARII